MNRYGKFYISYDTVDQRPSFVAQVLAKIQFCPGRVEALLIPHSVEMSGYSPMFRQVADCDPLPEYDLIIDTDNHGDVISVTAKEMI